MLLLSSKKQKQKNTAPGYEYYQSHVCRDAADVLCTLLSKGRGSKKLKTMVLF